MSEATELEQTPAGEDTGEEVRPLDFSQPTKFVPELRRRIAMVLAPFAKSTSMRLSGELKASVELHVVSGHELGWSAARSKVPEEAALVEVDVKPIGGQMLLAVDQQFLLRGIECLLGGSAAHAPTERRLTEIDLALVTKLMETVVGQLSASWRDLGGLELSVGDIDVERDHEAGVEVQLAEPTYHVELRCEIAGLASRLDLLLPWLAIEPVASAILEPGQRPGTIDPRNKIALRHRLSAVEVLLHAEVGARELALGEVVGLRAGDLLELRTKASRGVRLATDRLVLGYGQPGRSGARKAVKLDSGLTPVAGPRLLPPPELRSRHPRSASDQLPARVQLAKLQGARVRVWAELGRVVLPLETVLALPAGAVIELDDLADAPLSLYAAGLRFGAGELLVDDGGEWAIRLVEPQLD